MLPADLQALYPFRHHFLELGGPRMHYLDEGQGPAVLMLHGNPTWSFYYRELVLGLRDQYRVIVPDHIGCGLSDKPQNYSYTLATHIANVERLVDSLKLADVTLAVHDWGGAIGFGWAMKHLERVARLVVFNTSAFFGPVPLRIRFCRWPLVGEVVVRGLNGFTRAALCMATAKPGRMTREVRSGYLFPYRSYRDRVAVLRFVRDIPVSARVPSHFVLQAIEESLPRFAAHPMILFWGAKDFCFHDGFLEGWTSLPRAEVHRFDDAGHYVVEDAHERIVPLMQRFMSADANEARPVQKPRLAAGMT